MSSSLLLKPRLALQSHQPESRGAINVSFARIGGVVRRETEPPGIESADLGVHLQQEMSLHSTAH